jgi:hypothetical protein
LFLKGRLPLLVRQIGTSTSAGSPLWTGTIGNLLDLGDLIFGERQLLLDLGILNQKGDSVRTEAAAAAKKLASSRVETQHATGAVRGRVTWSASSWAS